MTQLASLKRGWALLVLAGSMCWSAMAMAATPLITTNWLADRLANDRLVVIDLRNKIDSGSYETFLQGHIPGSVHSDYLKDGWRVGKDDVVGLLPTEAQFEALARKLGVSSDSHVILVPAGVSSTDYLALLHAHTGRSRPLGMPKYLFWMAALPHGRQTSQTELPQARLTHHRLAILPPDLQRHITRTFRQFLSVLQQARALYCWMVAQKASSMVKKSTLNHASMAVFRALLYSRSQMLMMRAPTGLSHRVSCPRYTQIMQMSH